MIRDTSLSDTVVKRKPRFGRVAIAAGATVGGAMLFLSYLIATPWLQAERTVSSDRLRIATVERGHFERSISVQGTVDAVIRPTLYSPTVGVISLRVRAGDVVEESELLAEIDNPDLRHQLEQERSRLLQFENELTRLRISTSQQKLASGQDLTLEEIALRAARRERERVAEAVLQQVIRSMDLDIAQDEEAAAMTRVQHSTSRIALENQRLDFELESKALEVARQRQAVEELDRQVAESRIVSPTAGVVGNILIQERDNVTLNQPLMTVVNSSVYEVLVTIPESSADNLAAGMQAFINAQGRQIVGTLTSVSPEVTNGHVEGRIAIAEDMTRDLRQRQRLTVRIVLDSKEDVLTVPRGPFIEDGAGRVAYVVEGRLASIRPIQTGAVGVSQVEVVEGLDEGEQIIISSISGFEQAKTILIR